MKSRARWLLFCAAVALDGPRVRMLSGRAPILLVVIGCVEAIHSAA